MASNLKTVTSKKEKKLRGSDLLQLLAKTSRAAFPENVSPMLATLVKEPFDEKGWLYEVKWDGYRALALINEGKVELKSRNNKSFDEKFYPLVQSLQGWKINAVLDGEIVVPDEHGISSFAALQNWRSEADGELIYYVFDILWYEGRDLRDLPLSERRKILEAVLPDSDNVRASQIFDASGTDMYDAAKRTGLEGIIAKKSDSAYASGERSKQWLKIKASKRQEMVIGGYTRNEGSKKPFSSLLVGVFENGKLHYTGKIGTGFNLAAQREMLQQFKKLETGKSPFVREPDINKPSRFRPDPPHATATWLKPVLVCEVSYAEMTSDGIMRHPSFEGMRIDKSAKEVNLDVAADSSESIREANLVQPVKKRSRSSFLNPHEETQVREVNGHLLKFTNLSKVFWPDTGLSKRDLINYYYRIAPYILPYLKNRVQSMYRFPNGIHDKSFYFKNVKKIAPGWAKTYDYHSENDNEDKQYLVAEDEASLLFMANLGCIEMNPWSSTVDKEDYPDWCIIDLDPADTTFEQVIEAARVTKNVLDSLAVPGYPKTSGSSGIHIYIPLGAKYTYEQSKEFARVIAQLVHREIPEFTSIERAVKDRGKKMYIDFLQNRPHATVSAPYSVRPKPGATVSMPLHWEEVKKGLKMTDFTMLNAVDRVKSEGDIFKPVLGKGIDMKKVIAKFQQ